MSSQFDLGFFFDGFHVLFLVCMFVCSVVFEGRKELRVEGEWGTPEETGTRVGTELQLVRISRNRLRARINNTMYRLPKLLWLFRRKCLLIERTFCLLDLCSE